MKWIKENKLKSATMIVAFIGGTFGALNQAFNFFEQHIAINPNDKREWHKPKTPEGMTYAEFQEEMRHIDDQKVNRAE